MMKEIAVGIALGGLAFVTMSGYNVLPLLILAGLFYVLLQTSGFRGFQRKMASVGAPAGPCQVSFRDIGGQVSAIKELVEALDFLGKDELRQRLGIRPLKGILLTGPPGTGKTMLAKAAATHTNSVFLATSGSEFIEVYAGVGAQRVRNLFNQAREAARREKRDSAIVFIDEIEVLGGKRGQHTSHLEYDQTLNQLLVEMDGLTYEDDVKILVVGATNRVDLLDSALLRPGRFDRIVRVELPDKDGRIQILKLHTRNKPLADDVDIEVLARETFGFSGAHLESLANEAAILAMREEKDTIEQRHFMEAVDKVIMGEKLDRRPAKQELKRIAVHEGGHAVAGEVIKPGSVASITIGSRGNALGYVRQSPEDDTYLHTRETIERDIAVLLAGAIAEELVYGDRSTGASNDFERAVGLARDLVGSGLSPLGVVDEDLIPSADLHRAVQEILRAQEDRVKQILSERRTALERIGDVLVEQETLSGDRFRGILAEVPLDPGIEERLTA